MPRSGAAGVDHPVDPILAKVALAIGDGGGNARATQSVEFIERRSSLLTWGRFS
jgi:hypothetical protein